MSWKKPKQAEFGSGQIFLRASNRQSERAASRSDPAPHPTVILKPGRDRHSFMHSDCVAHSLFLWLPHFCRGFQCVTLREMDFVHFFSQQNLEIFVRPQRCRGVKLSYPTWRGCSSAHEQSSVSNISNRPSNTRRGAQFQSCMLQL